MLKNRIIDIMPRREHTISAEPSPNYLLYMPLMKGDLTDHVSGGSVVQNGNVSWNSNVGAYEFRQTGKNSNSQIAYATGLDLPQDIFIPSFNFVREYDVYPISSTGGSIRIMSHSAGFNIQLNNLVNISNPSHVLYLPINQWGSFKEILTGNRLIRYKNGVQVQDFVITLDQQYLSLNTILFTCGIIGDDYNNVRICIKNFRIYRYA